MKLKTLFIAALSLLAFANCESSEGEQSEQETQKNTVLEEGWEAIMEVHDEIMPISMKLPPIWEELDSLKDIAEEEQAIAIKENITTLQKVHKDMYDWMDASGAIRERLDNAAADQLNTIIEEEKLRIAQIKEETNAAYEAAQGFLSLSEKE